ncbi:unnamed protein product [Orchesella dallaii]|uniref:CHK kinase-like domain-containing protein n=1 Tax=Orchesella dallaii TaxID=48710 RepID=A0ABP1PNB5_9HEXA
MKHDDTSKLINLIKNLLEDGKGYELSSFLIEEGTNLGDNFMSVLYSITVEAIHRNDSSSKITHHYLLKCYPSHPSRQTFLNNSNLFYKEVSFYMTWAKDVILFQKNTQIPDEKIIQLAIPKCVLAEAINFETCEPEEKEVTHGPLSNYIMMVDLRKEGGFKMANKMIGLDVDHVKLAFNELAKMHALSWAYRNKVEWDVENKFPFLKRFLSPRKTEMWLGILKTNIEKAVTAIEAASGRKNVLSESLKDFSTNAKAVIESFISQTETSEESLLKLHRHPFKLLQYEGQTDAIEPWRVVSHGDCWSNNFLFQYDQQTRKPMKVALVDFPLARLSCPTLDLSCLVYTSTRRSFREMHLEECLKCYHDTFTKVCEQMGVEPLPGFSLTSLKMKFHVMKLVGFLIAAISLPLNLVELGKEVDFEQKNDNVPMQDMFREACDSGEENSSYQTWILELVEELYDEGVI